MTDAHVVALALGASWAVVAAYLAWLLRAARGA